MSSANVEPSSSSVIKSSPGKDKDIVKFEPKVDVMAVSTANLSVFGNFKPDEEKWEAYVERFDCFVKCSNISDDLKVTTMLTVIGSKVYGLLRDLCSPRKPHELGYNELIKLIGDHLSPKPAFRAERFEFYRRFQSPDESISEYLVALKKMATTCNFGATLNDRLHDMLICGITSKNIRERLISDDSHTFEQAVSLALAIEKAHKEASKMSVDVNSNQSSIKKISKKGLKKNKTE